MAVYDTMKELLEDRAGRVVNACRSQNSIAMYTMRLFRRDSVVAIIAPHGGKIEHDTSQIAEKIADVQHNFFAFEGDMRKDNHATLHVTSTEYDAPDIALDLISNCSVVLAIHGAADVRQPDGKPDLTVYVGGRNIPYRTAIQEALDLVAQQLAHCEFRTAIHPNPDLQGEHPLNICNRGNHPDGGVQLEISSSLRKCLCEHDASEPDDLAKFAKAIQSTIDALVRT
jgi:phage replication-related protein YjqB (UPF0714/DUF867 family)